MQPTNNTTTKLKRIGEKELSLYSSSQTKKKNWLRNKKKYIYISFHVQIDN